MARAGDDLELHLASHPRARLLVQGDDRLILTANDEQGWRLYLWQRVTGKIGTSAAGDDRCDILRQFSRGDECRAATGACAEITQRQLARGGLIQRPSARVHQPLREQADVETVLRCIGIDRFLFTSEKIEQQSGEP